VKVGRDLLTDHLAELPNVQAIVADRGYRGLATLAARRQLTLDIKAPPKGMEGFVPMLPLVRVEHAFARLGRWRRLALLQGNGSERASLARGRLGRPTYSPGCGQSRAGTRPDVRARR
jgi:hypothetical protein